jgi:flagellar hook-length control protein FliK
VPEITPAIAAPIPVPAPVAGIAAAPPAANDPTTVTDFMGQLTAALKGLKGLAAAVKGLPAPPWPAGAADAVADPAAPAADDASQPTTPGPQAPSDDVTELLATLGLLLVPTPQTAPLSTDTPSASKGTVASAPQTPGSPTPLTSAPTQTAPATGDQASSETVGLPPTAQQPTGPDAAKHQTAPVAAPQMPQPPTPNAPAVPADAQPVSQQPQTSAPQTPAPQAPGTPVASALQAQLHNPASDSAFQQGAGSQNNDQHHDGTQKSAPVAAAATDRAEPVPAHVYAEAANAAAPTTPPANAAPANPQAADVASQIAQQVDLYRLPGNKGVRIQLHPEDLGGVQVTVRYAAGGNLELHINVEHADTGNLVQAGLSQLRDALATQGFHPDRMVMSITAPSSANQMDFSGSNSNNASYRSDAGMTAFTQDQSGQQRPDAEDLRVPRVWSASAGSTTATDDSPRASTLASAAASRIDYRV